MKIVKNSNHSESDKMGGKKHHNLKFPFFIPTSIFHIRATEVHAAKCSILQSAAQRTQHTPVLQLFTQQLYLAIFQVHVPCVHSFT